VLSSGGERIGLLVDSISDVVTASSTDIVDAPGNLSGVDGRFFRGVLKRDGELLLVLDVDEVLA
jgi:purine-binding chemotaxis protein CheW